MGLALTFTFSNESQYIVQCSAVSCSAVQGIGVQRSEIGAVGPAVKCCPAPLSPATLQITKFLLLLNLPRLGYVAGNGYYYGSSYRCCLLFFLQFFFLVLFFSFFLQITTYSLAECYSASKKDFVISFVYAGLAVFLQSQLLRHTYFAKIKNVLHCILKAYRGCMYIKIYKYTVKLL